MKTFYLALGFCTFAATGCIIESHPANSTPETAPSSSAAPTAEPTAAPAPTHGVPPAMREAPKTQ